jgi:peptidoglycan/LPS O-acetylase OafA/YrhL
MRLTSPWVFDRVYGLPHLRPLIIALSVFFWGFVLWIVFWAYRAARGKYERFLFASFAIGFVLGVIGRFMPPQIAANMQFLSTAAALVSLAAAVTLLFTLPANTTTPQ